jgi:hypothetical protein
MSMAAHSGSGDGASARQSRALGGPPPTVSDLLRAPAAGCNCAAGSKPLEANV